VTALAIKLPVVDCAHARPGAWNHVVCAKGLLGGRPSHGSCANQKTEAEGGCRCPAPGKPPIRMGASPVQKRPSHPNLQATRPPARPIPSRIITAGPSAADTRGPARWADLHRTALAADAEGWDDAKWVGWLTNWLGSLSVLGTCQCRSWSADYIRDHPSVAGQRFAWSVAMHNAVNVKLGKEVKGEDAARAHWTQGA
jgi:hypothetical protein